MWAVVIVGISCVAMNGQMQCLTPIPKGHEQYGAVHELPATRTEEACWTQAVDEMDRLMRLRGQRLTYDISCMRVT